MTLNLGSGICNRKHGEVDFDINIMSAPDVCGDAAHLPFKDETFTNIRSVHVLEHVDDIIGTMDECHRVLKKGGEFTINVPLFPSMWAMADPTHKRFFIPETFYYFTEKDRLTGLKHIWMLDKMVKNDKEIACILKKV